MPLIMAEPLLRSRGISLDFHSAITRKTDECDYVAVNSNFFRSFWKERKNEIFDFLETCEKKSSRVLWFDTTDSTWCTQFEVLPYVEKFLKSQILADKELYMTPFRTGRIFTDYFDEIYQSGERESPYPPPSEKEQLEKIGVSWNTCFENYTPSRYSLNSKLAQRLFPKIPFLRKHLKLDVPFQKHKSSRRDIGISCRIGTSHDRPSVVAHRKHIVGLLEKRGVETAKLSLEDYFKELARAKIGVGPFGVGEITLRDFEIIICGALLLKPDMSHMKTWPDLFVPNETYIPHKWDLSDFDEQIDKLLASRDLLETIADNATKKYQWTLSEEGIEAFAERFASEIIGDRDR